MTKQDNNPDYSAQVADLVEQAFKDLGNGLVEDHGSNARDNFLAEAQARLAAAQTIATLANAREARIHNLLMAATAAPGNGAELNTELVEAAYGAALTMLGLAEEDPRDLAELRAALGLDDPADRDHGDLP